VLLHRETIGTACLSGALVYLSLDYMEFDTAISVSVAGLIVVLVREISIKYNWHLPKLSKD
jgi:uncharacterized membrane protein YeiH